MAHFRSTSGKLLAVIAGLVLLTGSDRPVHMPGERADVRNPAVVDLRGTVRRITSDDLGERGQAFADVSNAWRSNEASLTKILDNKDLPGGRNAPRRLAAQILSTSPRTSAIEALIRHIAYFQPDIQSQHSPTNSYPCAEALGQIGLTCVPHIFSYLAGKDEKKVSEKEIWLFAQVVHSVYGLPTEINGGPDEARVTMARFLARRPPHFRPNVQRLIDKFNSVAVNPNQPFEDKEK